MEVSYKQMDNQIPYDLIAKHLASETAEQEDAILWQWIDQSESNLIIFQELVSVYADNPSIVQEWNSKKAETLAKIKSKQSISYYGWRIAASISLIIMVVYFFNSRRENGWITLQNESIGVKEVVLPDSTTVWLNSLSSIKYNKNSFLENRQIELEGEAFFKIKEQNEVFIIEYDSMILITKSGEYNIQSYSNQDEKIVIVSDGAAQFMDLRNDEVILSATSGEKLVSLAGYGILSLEINTELNYDSWRTGNYMFDNTPLNVIAEMISKDQNLNLQIPDKEMRYQRFNGYFEGLNSRQVLHQLMLELDAKVEIRQGENYLVKNKKS